MVKEENEGGITCKTGHNKGKRIHQQREWTFYLNEMLCYTEVVKITYGNIEEDNTAL